MQEDTSVVNIMNIIVQQPLTHWTKHDKGNKLKTLKFQWRL
jgi:hypothetical protein